MADSSRPSQLLSLPLEIQQSIFSYLVDSPTPDLAVLRRTHSSFRAMMPKSQLRSTNMFTYQLNRAGNSYPYLLPAQHLPCTYCNKVLNEEFIVGSDVMKRDDGDWKVWICIICNRKKGQYVLKQTFIAPFVLRCWLC